MGRAFEYRRTAKEKRWDKMSKVFPKLGKLITIAAKEGGPDPEMNAKLRHAILNAKAENMPKENIEAAIKRASGKEAESMVEVVYEGKGPHGVLVFVECATDNTTRTVANVKSYFNKAGGALVPNGSLEFMFSRKAVFECRYTEEIDLEELELELIDAGLEEIDQHEELVVAFADYTYFGTMQQALERLGIEILKANLQRFPTNPVSFSEEQMAEIDKMLDKIEEDDDVQAVYTNIGEA
ncbi:MAG: YebC/PmpR family DNA-binding transcriptional regulator [Bacteroidales bacterium]|jgi:YebC/PmpR family DNA-binding regulatory protein|nr:YebC/PmpR family DNA-binding transcriptional regulator [Bacteroidales bacterium]MDD3700445.1 YebC/PmpR family DNA-binding transcriptional regulator [Bacteroidales bacterium]MDY0368669.1 YebC/PmpR family DNA-binding transcriptional regulator [Bacteroidales bacterium]